MFVDEGRLRSSRSRVTYCSQRFQAFLDQVTAEAAVEVQARWIDKLAGVDVFVDSDVRTALIYVRWDD